MTTETKQHPVNADDVLRDALTAAVKRVADATGLPVYQGSPEA